MIKYNKTDWTKLSKISPQLLNNIENGITNCINYINELPLWVTNGGKPSYDVSEINGAASRSDINTHNILGNSHTSLFNTKADLIHTHSVEDITDLNLSNIEEMKSDINQIKADIAYIMMLLENQ